MHPLDLMLLRTWTICPAYVLTHGTATMTQHLYRLVQKSKAVLGWLMLCTYWGCFMLVTLFLTRTFFDTLFFLIFGWEFKMQSNKNKSKKRKCCFWKKTTKWPCSGW